jgi:hypothetical protein
MKKILTLCFVGLLICSSCEKDEPTNNTSTNSTNTGGSNNCGWYNGKPTYKGPNGGCYYYNSNGNKTYVDSQYCPC